MDIIKTLNKAINSRLTGGIFLDGFQNPIKKDQLEEHLTNVKDNKGLRDYFHLDEENAILTKFTKKNNTYNVTSRKTIPLKLLNFFQVEYEVLMGFDRGNLNCRTPNFYGTNGGGDLA